MKGRKKQLVSVSTKMNEGGSWITKSICVSMEGLASRAVCVINKVL